MTRKPVLAAAAFACVSLSFAAAGAERLNVKTGLWEIESLTQMGGTLPLSKDLKARLTPAQIAKMQADWKAEAAKGPERDVSQECITAKDIEQPFHAANADGCRQTFVSTSRTAQEVRLVCEGERKGSGVLEISTPTPQSMTGTLDMKFGEGAEVFTMKGTLKGRWLGDDCGDEADDSDVASDEDDEPADDTEEEEE
ncbi:MAG TPA: DUF3617 domain-containing protein [Povalibacter sp.]|uniref:DUF3617 domain-containing protein n=1 Tax=Povalibacter sp. TaxID=1962978 RepID=UPI002B782F33|nr:DUF3617 domain-containing protein [Povalibacter sp.]HMN47342.1 DUF3617 domain-containing protein [Povalibacter sp.]